MINTNKIFDFIGKNSKAIIILGAVILAIMYFRSCSSNIDLKNYIKSEEARTEQNIKSLNDSVSKYKNKDGDISYDKVIGNMSKDELKQYNPELFDAIKSEGGEVKTVTKYVVEYRDTGYVDNEVNIVDSSKNEYSLDAEYTSKDGVISTDVHSTFFVEPNSYNVKPGVTTFKDTKISFGLTTGIKKGEDGIERIFVTPSSDKITISDIQGSDVTDYIKDNTPKPKSKKFSLNVSIGYGVVFGSGGNVYHGPGAQIGIGYNILSFGKRRR